MCNVEEIADCGDILTLGRALFIPEKEGMYIFTVFTIFDLKLNFI